MRKLTSLIVAILLMLCLPLQGVAGVLMPACAEHMAQMTSPIATQEVAMSHCAQHAKQAVANKQIHKTDKAASYAKCHACYLSVAQALASGIFQLASPGTTQGYAHMVDNKYQTKLSSPFHPPKSTSALG